MTAQGSFPAGIRLAPEAVVLPRNGHIITAMLSVGAGFRRLQPFSRVWLLLFAGALFLTFGFGGGTPNSTGWLIGEFLLLGVLLTSLLVELASQLQDRRRRDH